MASAKVTIKELDLSTRVPSFPGVYSGIVIPALKGPVNEAFLCTSETALLKTFTPDGEIAVGDDLSFFSALAYLEKGNKLWVVRSANSPLHGGVSVESADSTTVSASFVTGEDDPENDHSFGVDEVFAITGSNPGDWCNDISILLYNYRASETFTVTVVGDTLTVTQDWATGSAVILSPTTTLPAPLAINTVYYCIRINSTTVKLATTLANAIAGTEITLTDAGTGVHTIALVTEKAKEVDSFLIEIYKNSVLVESWPVSRKKIKDGFGQNMYIEDVLEGSNYIRAIDNVAELDTVLPADILTAVSLGGGTDGGVVTDSHMVTALDKLKNPNDIPLTLILDGGWTTSTYQLQLVIVAEARNAFAIMSIPYSAQATTNYLNEIVEYKRLTLNVDSSFASLMVPHVQVYDKANDRHLWVSPDGYNAAQISETAGNREIWISAAGHKRGVINVEDVKIRFEEGELDYIADNSINPIRFIPGRGIKIWGAKTTLSRPSHLQHASVRFMLMVVEPAIQVALEDFLWESNTPASRATARILIEAYLGWIKARGGVRSFQVVCDTSNNLEEDIAAGRMVIWVLVEPVVPILQIPVTVAIVKSGSSYSLAVQSL